MRSSAQCSMAATAQMKEGEKCDLLARLASEPAFGMTEAEMEAVLTPSAYIGRCPEQVDRLPRVKWNRCSPAPPQKKPRSICKAFIITCVQKQGEPSSAGGRLSLLIVLLLSFFWKLSKTFPRSAQLILFVLPLTENHFQ